MNSLTRKTSYKQFSPGLEFCKGYWRKKNFHKGIKNINQRNFTLTNFLPPQNFLEKEGQSSHLLSLDHFD